MKRIIFAFSCFIYLIMLCAFFLAHAAYVISKNSAEPSPQSAARACFFNPLNSDYTYNRYVQLKRAAKQSQDATRQEKSLLLDQALACIRRAITLEPTRAAYHLYYALTLLERHGTGSDAIRKEALSHFKKAAQLKPYSPKYKAIWEQMEKIYG